MPSIHHSPWRSYKVRVGQYWQSLKEPGLIVAITGKRSAGWATVKVKATGGLANVTHQISDKTLKIFWKPVNPR